MTEPSRGNAEQILVRMERKGFNIFARLPAIYAVSRTQSRNFLEIAGGLSVGEWHTLWDLAEAGHLTIKDRAAVQQADQALPSRALRDMCRKGYVMAHNEQSPQRPVEYGGPATVRLSQLRRPSALAPPQIDALAN